MVWVKFILAAAVIVFAANYLAKYGDIIAVRTKLGGMFIGILLLAGATSLPELLTSASAISQGTPNLAAGNLLGSNSFNMLLLAVIDMIYRKKRVLRNAALKHALTGSLAIVLIGVVMFFILAKIDFAIGWVGIDSLFIIAFYIFAVWLIQKNSSVTVVQQPVDEDDAKKNSLLKGIIGFLAAAAVLVLITPVMVRNANEIAIITGLGTTFIGTTLVAIVTSLPELVTTLAAVKIGAEDMAIGNLFGSNMFNMFLLGFLDLLNRRARILRKVAHRHALSGSIASLLSALAIFFVLADIDLKIGWVGLDSLVLIAAYVAGIRLIRNETGPVADTENVPVDSSIPSLKKALGGFALATAVLVAIMPLLVKSSNEIALITGLGAGFIGTALVSIVTSLPELVTTIAAVRLGVYDLAIGNLFGSNMFNMFALGLSDFFLVDQRFLGIISPGFALVGLIGLIMTLMGIIGNQARLERRILFLEVDAFLLIVAYFLGMFLIYQRGIGL